IADGVFWAAVDAPPINVMTTDLAREIATLGREVLDDDAVRVVVLQSANPEFFIAHFDVHAILAMPARGEATRQAEISGFHRMCERWRIMPKVSIVKVAGRVGGGGAELSASCDMRFGVL